LPEDVKQAMREAVLEAEDELGVKRHKED